jgi:hypothetical protein
MGGKQKSDGNAQMRPGDPWGVLNSQDKYCALEKEIPGAIPAPYVKFCAIGPQQAVAQMMGFISGRMDSVRCEVAVGRSFPKAPSHFLPGMPAALGLPHKRRIAPEYNLQRSRRPLGPARCFYEAHGGV